MQLGHHWERTICSVLLNLSCHTWQVFVLEEAVKNLSLVLSKPFMICLLIYLPYIMSFISPVLECIPMTKKDNNILGCIRGCIRKGITVRSREMILPLYSALLRSHLECWVQLRAPQYKKYMNFLEQLWCRVTKMLEGLQHPTYKERLRQLGLLSLEDKGHGVT